MNSTLNRIATPENSKIQVSNSKEKQSIKAKAENKKYQDLFLEFDYSLAFGFWNLEFLGLWA